ncbi:hypothetical protein SeseC_00244 [Streptococcus equi subsp. zooepidemicus ATCC 35246]|nr:hypothetical protein SeseC_00244 [Streptococcus equi subsp. zooepidemicus ATCC 35246]AIA68919.1 hypothetical protein Q426_08225 [Streptococcus equi subsp. zooepidemicus CY]
MSGDKVISQKSSAKGALGLSISSKKRGFHSLFLNLGHL